MNATTEAIHVTMHVASRKKTGELKTDRQIQHSVDAALKGLMHPLKSGEELAKRLSLPANVPIVWDVRILELKKGFRVQEGHIPIMVSVAGVPDMMERLRPEIVEEITNILFKELGKESEDSKELAKVLGYETEKPAKFSLYLPHQVQARGPAKPGSHGDVSELLDWIQGGWSKGCSSWPW